MTPGRLVYLAYYRPLASLARCRREGGPWQQWLDARGRRAMSAAAGLLPPLPPVATAASAPEVFLLTGRRFWYQSAFCVYSLARQLGPVRPVFIDDGTFDDALAAEAHRLFPGSRVQRAPDTAARLDTALPAAKFSTLRAQRLTYIHLRKLTDVHAGLSGYRLVLDSDMLFFRPPFALHTWLAAPDRPMHMLDVQDAYGYPDATLRTLAGRLLPARLNVGICGLRSDALDWEKLEWWSARLIAQHGTSYYLEQALVALLLADADPLRLPAADYLLLPTEDECRAPTAALHHYVAESKRGYFRHAWRHVLNA